MTNKPLELAKIKMVMLAIDELLVDNKPLDLEKVAIASTHYGKCIGLTLKEAKKILKEKFSEFIK
jgi:hypothetical protein